MFQRSYDNFVRSTSSAETAKVFNKISGDEAMRLYLEEVDDVRDNQDPLSEIVDYEQNVSKCVTKHKREHSVLDLSNLKLFTSVQDNDVDSLRQILDAHPDKITTIDNYGWSLLMIGCQANSYDAVKELLNRGIDTSICDRAGNSAQSLIIRNRSSHLANILLSHVSKSQSCKVKTNAKSKVRHKEKYVCQICNNNAYDSKEEHISSTIHNINASKGKKVPMSYSIPASNKGFQIMLKTGWDKDTGLGPDGSGKKYPIKAVQKYDKKGLGHEKKRLKTSSEESTQQQNKKQCESAYHRNRRLEINFRRQFY